MEEEECAPQLAGQVQVERQLFAAWLDEGTHLCGGALLFHASNMQREERRGAACGDSAFDFLLPQHVSKGPPEISLAHHGITGPGELYLMAHRG